MDRPWCALVIALVAFVTGCPAPLLPPGGCVADCTGHVSGSSSVNLLVRSLLLRGADERPTYAFYAYLYFADKGLRAASTRGAAAAAVLQLFSDVGDIRELRLKESQLAVLHLPVASLGAAQRILKSGTPDSVTAGYDYDRARLLRRQIEMHTGIHLPSVALLGYAKPLLDPRTEVQVSHLYVIALDGMPDADVQDRILRFRDALELSVDRLQDLTPGATHPAQNYFALVGSALQGYGGPR